jgi:hypothetical protein
MEERQWFPKTVTSGHTDTAESFFYFLLVLRWIYQRIKTRDANEFKQSISDT